MSDGFSADPRGGAAPDDGQPIVSPTTWPVAAPVGYDVMIVGAGIAGAAMAERLSASGRKVLVVDRRPHVGGNAHDRYDAAGIPIDRRHGPPIFHTGSAEVFDYLSRFTEWRPYEDRMPAHIDGRLVPMPRTTLNARAEPVAAIRTGTDVPLAGDTHMVERMLDHPDIDVLLGVEYADARAAYPHDHLVFTGPIADYLGERQWDPRYPLPGAENRVLSGRDEALAIAETDVTFVGRLVTDRDCDMDQIVARALATCRRLVARLDATTTDLTDACDAAVSGGR